MIGMSCMFNLSEPLVIPRKKISTFVEAGLCTAYIWICRDSNHSIFRYDNFIGCFSADKIKMSVRK